MADVNANIGVHIDTSAALAELKNLQRQLANFHSSVSKSSAAAAMAQKGLQTNLLNSINATGKFRAQMGLVRTSTESFTHALETNKLSMREYFRFAGGSTRTFGKLFKQEFNTIGKVAEERVKKMQTQYIKMGRDASGAMKAISITPNTLNMKDYSTKLAVAAQKQALLNQLLKQGSTNLLNFGKNTQWAGRQLMVGFTIPLAYFGTAAAKTFMDLEKQAIRFKRVYGDMFTTTDQTNKALADVQQLAEEFTKYGVAVADTMEMAASAAAMGKTGADLTAQVAQATRLAVLGGVEQAQALETTISVTNAFGVAAEDLASKINFLNAVENQTVVSIEDLTIAIPKAGPVVKQLGGDVEDLAFFLTAMKEGGINASEGANALKSGLASLINPTEKASKMLAGFGININAIVEGNQGNIKETVIDFAQALDTLDPLNRARAIEQLFGKFQFSRLSTLFQNVTKDGTQAAKVLNLAGASIEELAIMSERELGVLEDAVGTNFKESIEKLKLAIAPIGKTFLEAVTPIVQVVGRLLDKFNNLGDGTKKFIVIATTLVGVIGPVLLMTFGLLLNAGANIIKLFATMRSGFLKAGTNSGLLAQQTQYLNTEQLEAATVAASLNQAHTRLTQSFAAETTAVRLLRQAYIDATIAATNFARANPGMMMPGRGAVGGKVPKKFASGITKVPGRGNKDTVPSMLTPGEAVIPAPVAQDPRFQPIIDAMINGNLQGFNNGSADVQPLNGLTEAKRKAIKNRFKKLYSKDPQAKQSYKQNSKNFNELINRLTYDPSTKTYSLTTKKGKVYTKISENKIFEKANYVFGKTPSQQNQFINNTKFGRPSSLEKQLQRSSKEGMVSTGAPGQVRRLRDAYNQKSAGLGLDRENLALTKELRRQGLTSTEINNFMGKKSESHIFKPLDPKTKWQSGLTISDHEGIGQYLNRAGKRSVGDLVNNSKLLKELGYTDKDISKLKQGYAFAQQERQPTNAKQLGHLTRIADLEVKAHNSGKVNIPNIYQAKGILGVSAIRTPEIWKEISRSIIKLGDKPRFVNKREQARLEKVAVKPGQKVLDSKTGRGVPPSTVPLTSTDKAAIPIGQKLNHPKAVMVGRGRFIPPLGATANLGFNADGSPILTKPGMAVSEVEKQFRSEQKSLRRQIEKVEQRRLVALKQELKIVEDKNKLATQAAPLTKQQLKEQKREVRAQRAQRVGRVAGPVAGIAGIGAMAGFATGNNNLGMGMMGVSALAQIAPSLTNPLGMAVAAAATLAGGFYLLNKEMVNARKKQIEYIDSITASTKKMQKVGELTGKVGASQIAERQRETGTRSNEFRTGYDREDNQFGTNFLSSEIGKEIFKGFNDSVAKDGPKAAKLLATQLAAYISDGVMSAEQANSVARAIGINLGDMSVFTNISGELRELVGPDGQNLLTDPLKVRINIITTQEQNTQDLSEKIENINGQTSGKENRAFAAATAVSIGKNLQIIQAQRDAQFQTNQSIIDGLEKQKATTTDKAKQLQLENQIIDAKAKQKTEDAIIAEKTKENLKNATDIFEGLNSASFKETYIKTLRDSININQKDNPFLKLFLEAGSALKDESLEVQINTAVEGGLLNISTALKLMEMFAGTEDGEAKLKTVIETTMTSQDPGVFKTFMEIMSGKKIDSKIQMAILTDQDKFEDRVKVLDKLKDFDGDAINLEVFVNDITETGLDELAEDFRAIEKIKSPITVKTLAEISTITNDPNIDMSGLVDIWSKYENATDEIKKTVIQEYIAVFKSIGDEEVENLIKNELAGFRGSPDRMDDKRRQAEAKYFTIDKDGNFKLDKDGKRIPTARAAGALVSQSGVGAPNIIPGGGDDDGTVGGTRDTTFDDILINLKRTRDATINAQGGAKELIRILGGAKDLKAFNGIDQQLSKIGANSDFIDFVGGLEKAIQNDLIKISKKGVVSLTELGEAAKKAYDEKQLGLFSAANAQAINESMKQRDAFVKLKAAGLDTATAQELLADKTFMVSLAAQKNSKEIKDMINEYKNLKNVTKETTAFVDPLQAFKDEMEDDLKYYDFLEKQARANVKTEIERINDLIDANERLIEAQERVIEENINRPIGKFSQDLALIDSVIEKINEKYDAQQNALEKISEINDDIAAKELSRITIADALTMGDISAAAKAIQEQRAEEARRAKENSSKLLQLAREKEISKLTNADGLTKIQIEEKIYALEQQRLPLVANIVKLQDENYKLQTVTLRAQEDSLKATLSGIDAARFAYEQQVIAIEGANWKAKGFNDILLVAEDTLTRMKVLWEEISKASRQSLMLSVPENAFSIKGVDTIASNISSEVSKMTPEIIASKYISAAQAQQYLINEAISKHGLGPKYAGMLKGSFGMASGGMVPKYYVSGGYSKGTDTIPAMLTPGEFVVRRNAVDSFGVNNLNKINDGSYGGSSVYNYSLSVNVKSDSSPDDIARTVMTQIKRIDSQRIKTQRGA